MKFILCVFTFLWIAFSHIPNSYAQDKEKLVIAVIDWCPQICPNSLNKGYIVDIVEGLFKNSPYELSLVYAPWSRAIKITRSGKAIALLAPAKTEAPDLIYPAQEIGSQRMCFFTKRRSNWVYDGPDSLANQLTGVAANTSLPGLNEFVQENKKLFHTQPYSPQYLENSIRMLDGKRLDSFLFTQNTTLYEINQMGRKGDFKTVGCLEKEKVYMAFSPARRLGTKVNEIRTYFDEQMALFRQNNREKPLIFKYGIADPFK